MRDIKFRGLSKITGKFVYGNLIQTSEYKDGHIHCWIQEKSLLGLGALSTPTTNFIEVHSESVGQFTGLQDIEGDDIYEGDILHQLDPVYWEPVVVSFNECRGCYYINNEQLQASTIKQIELIIVGNISPNPELLEK